MKDQESALKDLVAAYPQANRWSVNRSLEMKKGGNIEPHFFACVEVDNKNLLGHAFSSPQGAIENLIICNGKNEDAL